VKDRPNAGSPFFDAFPSLRLRRMSVYTSLVIVAIPVNYTREFGEAFETAA